MCFYVENENKSVCGERQHRLVLVLSADSDDTQVFAVLCAARLAPRFTEEVFFPRSVVRITFCHSGSPFNHIFAASDSGRAY